MCNYSELTKEELFKLIADKDQGVVEYIYDKYSDVVYGMIVEKTKLREDADEILINTFVTFFKEKSYKGSVKNSIFIKLRNIALNLIKKGKVLYLAPSSAGILYSKLSFQNNKRKSS